jgi:DNA-binding SARP family transcriptional activator
VDFRLLGPLEVVADGRVLSLGGAKQRALLAALLLRASEVVSTDRLIDELWGEEPPPTAAKIVQVYVSQLRKVIESGGRQVILTQPPGYVARVESGQLDVHRFEGLVDDARAALASGSPSRASELLREALGLWRGPALADFAYEPFAQPAIARLEELRIAALEERLTADLALGRHSELVGELEGLVAEHPLRERLREHLMLALYRSGRQAEALEAYQDARRALVDELGIDPGTSLQELERAILRHDPALDLARAAADAARSAPPVERTILIVPSAEDALPPIVTLLEPLALSPARHGLLITQVVPEPDASEAAEEGLAGVTRRLGELSAALEARGVDARVAAFTSADPGEDIVRVASRQQVDLLVLDAAAEELDHDRFPARVAAALARAPCDVAILASRTSAPAPKEDGPVLAPFSASEHDWAALELGAWLARARGVPLRLLGTAPDHEQGRRDASRLLADASLIVQHLARVVPEPVLVRPGVEGVVEAAAGAGVLLLGLSERWRHEGLGSIRLAIARTAPTITLLVRRGVRPGGLSPPDGLTRFTWSLASASSRR